MDHPGICLNREISLDSQEILNNFDLVMRLFFQGFFQIKPFNLILSKRFFKGYLK